VILTSPAGVALQQSLTHAPLALGRLSSRTTKTSHSLPSGSQTQVLFSLLLMNVGIRVTTEHIFIKAHMCILMLCLCYNENQVEILEGAIFEDEQIRVTRLLRAHPIPRC
jgi:hypothetical protein